MRRREVIAGFGAQSVAWPGIGFAQDSRLPLIGFFSSRSAADSAPHHAGFLRGLKALNYVDGTTVRIAYRWADGHYDRLTAVAGEVAALQPAVIVAVGGSPAAWAAKSATSSIPICIVASDPVGEGLVASLAHPGDRITGVDLMSGELVAKRFEILAQAVPGGGAMALLYNSSRLAGAGQIREFERAGKVVGRPTLTAGASADAELEAAFATLTQKKAAALVVMNDGYFDSRREQLVALTTRHALPAVFHIREFPVAGGLMSYGASLVDAYQQMGRLVGRILRGASIADLPIERPTRFELTLNMKTARALDLAVPPSLLALIDEVIE
jgi:putative tryptophan/tyrosine transport system substrate-binding protein